MTPPLIAVRQLLLADTALNVLVGGRIYAFEFPNTEVANMPRKAVMLRSVGAGFFPVGLRDYVEISPLRIDVWAFGETPMEAQNVYHEVARIFKRHRGTTVYPFIVEGGPRDSRSEDTEWPVTIGTFTTGVTTDDQ